MLNDLDSSERIAQFVELFYARLLADERLAPLFLDVANIDISEHFPRICAYWEKLLLGHDDYHRHTMNIHRALDRKQQLSAADFDRWLLHFTQTVDENFSGNKADRAKRVATSIARNMQSSVQAQQ